MSKGFSYLIILLITVLFLPLLVVGQEKSDLYHKEISEYREELNKEFFDRDNSPLTAKDRKKFKGLEFFPINEELRIEAKFVRTPGQIPFRMPTTTTRLPVYEKYGEAHFVLNGENVILELFQSHDLRNTEEYADYLFLPFADLTNGETSYGGGRYLGLTIPDGDTIIIDFNKAYNPYCAYNGIYSCPKVPEQNFINAEINAGVMAYD